MFSPDNKYFVMTRTPKHISEADHLNLIFGFQKPESPRFTFFQDRIAGFGRLLVRFGSYLEKRYSRLADECTRENLRSLPTG